MLALLSNNYLLKLPHYSIIKPISLISNTFIYNTYNGIINFYDNRVNLFEPSNTTKDILTLDSNFISLPNSSYVVTGLTKSVVNIINIVLKHNNYTPTSLLLCNLDANESIIEE